MSVLERISEHQAAVVADEASFTDDGMVIDEDVARRTGESEARAFVDLKLAQCTNYDEVQAKLRYFLDGAIGERSSLVDYLFEHSHGADPDNGFEFLQVFLRTLLVPGGAA